MKRFFQAGLFLCLVLIGFFAGANDSTDLRLSFDQQRINDNEVLLTIKASVPEGVKLYGLQHGGNDALYSSISFDSAAAPHLAGAVNQKGATLSETDPSVEARVNYFLDSVLWQQKINAGVADSLVLKGSVSCLYKKGEEYLPFEQGFKFYINPEKRGIENPAPGAVADKSLWWIFLTAFGGGLLALLTPCVYSMIPITVSFFTKRSRSRREGIRNALFYSASIVGIFTGLGFLITLVFGPAALNNLATNWVANLVFFAVFLLFGFSFLGAFDIALPASWSTKADSKAGTGSFMGIFFMALTLAIGSNMSRPFPMP